jgi:hypothetical protein
MYSYLSKSDSTEWTNWHKNFTMSDIELWEAQNPPNAQGLTGLQPLVGDIQRFIDDCAINKKTLRAFGGTWSLSTVATSNDIMLDTRQLNSWYVLPTSHLSSSYPANKTIYLAQSGTSIRVLNDGLALQKQALITSGASDGQTLAGAVATGTHGSALEIGGMENFVVGLHILAGNGKNFWVERKSYPVANQTLLDKLQATLISDDDMFNSALVSFGSFGFIHAMAFEVVPEYYLELFQKKITHRKAKKLLATITSPADRVKSLEDIFSDIPEFSQRDASTIHHIEVDFNPHNKNSAFVSVMFPTSDKKEIPSCKPDSGTGTEMLGLLGTVLDIIGLPGSDITNTFIKLMSSTINNQFPCCQPFVRLPRGKMFSPTNTTGGIASVEFGIDANDCNAMLEALEKVNTAIRFPGAFAFRFVKKSQAMLGFTQFPLSCCVELPAVDSDHTHSFYSTMYSELKNSNIPYTMHWGQMNDYNVAGRLSECYTPATIDKWMQKRNQLLGNNLSVFNNTFLKDCGLDKTLSPILPSGNINPPIA